MTPGRPPGGLRGPPGDPLGPRGLPGRLKNRPRRAPGGLRGRKKCTGSGRGGARKVLGQFFSILSRPRCDFGLHFGRPWVLQGGHFGGSLLKAPKPWILNTFHVKTLILRVPGGHFLSFFGTKKNSIRQEIGPSDHQNQHKLAPGRSWRRLGANKNSGNPKKPSGRFLGPQQGPVTATGGAKSTYFCVPWGGPGGTF